MKAPHNSLFITVDSEHNDVIETKSGIKLYTSITKFHSDEANPVDVMKIKKHYGTIISVPSQLTDAAKVMPVNPGLPAPGRFVPNEDVIKMKSVGMEIDSWSCLNLFVHEWKTCADFEQETQEGDKVYFHFNSINDRNLVQYLGEKIYKLQYPNAICVVRDGVIIPIAGHILIEPIWDDEVQSLGNGKRGKLSESGIVTELNDKPKHLEGIVRYVCTPMQGDIMELEPGNKILYAPHADWEVEIEGTKYYVMKYWDIEAIIVD
jgi:co-chaperonin GroES (HSP10)